MLASCNCKWSYIVFSFPSSWIEKINMPSIHLYWCHHYTSVQKKFLVSWWSFTNNYFVYDWLGFHLKNDTSPPLLINISYILCIPKYIFHFSLLQLTFILLFFQFNLLFIYSLDILFIVNIYLLYSLLFLITRYNWS